MVMWGARVRAHVAGHVAHGHVTRRLGRAQLRRSLNENGWRCVCVHLLSLLLLVLLQALERCL